MTVMLVPVQAAWVRPEARALRAVAAGTATPAEQQLAVAAILQKACVLDQMSYVCGGDEADRATAFNEGRRFVGREIWRALGAALATFPEPATDAVGRAYDVEDGK